MEEIIVMKYRVDDHFEKDKVLLNGINYHSSTETVKANRIEDENWEYWFVRSFVPDPIRGNDGKPFQPSTLEGTSEKITSWDILIKKIHHSWKMSPNPQVHKDFRDIIWKSFEKELEEADDEMKTKIESVKGSWTIACKRN